MIAGPGVNWTVAWTALAAVAASISAVVAAIYTYLTHRLVRLNVEPKVIVYTKSDRERATILMIVVENIGRDIAHDVRFTADRAIPFRAFDTSLENARPAEEMRSGPLINGIPALGPGATREITWGQFGRLSRALGDVPIQITVTYRHGKRQFSDSAVLEVNSYEGTDASRTPLPEIARGTTAMATQLEQIADSLKCIAERTPPSEPIV